MSAKNKAFSENKQSYDKRFHNCCYSFGYIKFVAHQTQLWNAQLGVFYFYFISVIVQLTVKTGAVTKHFYVIKSCYEKLLLKALEEAVQ